VAFVSSVLDALTDDAARIAREGCADASEDHAA